MSKKHHILGPSSAPRWMKCPGSVIPKPPYVEAGDAANEGSAAHMLLETALMGIDHHTMKGMMVGLEGKQFEVTSEMLDAVDLFLNTVKGLAEQYSLDLSRLKSEQYFVAHDLFGGTCDFYLYQDGRLIVMDFKYGRKPVHASSLQLTCYALLIMGTMAQGEVQEVVQVVVQPRAVNGTTVSQYTPSWEEIVAAHKTVCDTIALVEAHSGATQPPRDLLVTGSHCEYCQKQVSCEAHLEMLGTAYEAAMMPVPAEEDEIPRLLEWLEKEDAITGFFKKVNSMLLSHAEAGRVIPGKKLVSAYGNRQWAIDEKLTEGKLASWLTRTFEVPAKDLKETSLKSPAQIEKILKDKGVFKEDKTAKSKLAEKMRREIRGVKLVDASAPGDVVDPQQITAFLSAVQENPLE